MEAVIHGIVLAFGLILPLGVQNVFVFTQGATQAGLLQAAPAAVTAALCDTLLILLAVLGLSMVVMQFEWLRIGLMSAGILFLIYMGLSIWRTRPASLKNGRALSGRRQIIFVLSVSLLNPHAILDIFGVIGTSALRYSGYDQFLFTASCIIISWLWFTGLMISGSILKRIDDNGRIMNVFNKCSALFIWGTAVYLIIGLFE